MSQKAKKSRLDRKLDKILREGENGKLSHTKTDRALRRWLSNRLAVAGAIVFLLLLFSCLLAPLIAPYDPLKPDLRSRNLPPCAEHLFGTDKVCVIEKIGDSASVEFGNAGVYYMPEN